MECSKCKQTTTPMTAARAGAAGVSPQNVKIGYECPHCGQTQSAEKLETEFTDEERRVWQRKSTRPGY